MYFIICSSIPHSSQSFFAGAAVEDLGAGLPGGAGDIAGGLLGAGLAAGA